MKSKLKLSDEQEHFINLAIEGHNLLVDACIGSGKTTSIQELCNRLPKNKKILYLTYNKLLKLEAKEKIKNKNALVTNYHGFVYPYLIANGLKSTVQNSIKTFVDNKLPMRRYDVLIIDEYQDISDEIASLLEWIKTLNPSIQIVAVGDMHQKIYDYTSIDIQSWMTTYLGDFIKVEFTNCFRLNVNHARKLGQAWSKCIIGVNDDQKIRYMNFHEAIDYISTLQPHETLVLGANSGSRSDALNMLSEMYPNKFNKYTVYNSTAQKDGKVEPSDLTYIFTTFDSSKGMERSKCFVFDYNKVYLSRRKSQPESNQEIINNLFLVAASRGKDEIIFVLSNNEYPSDYEDHYESNDFIGSIDVEEFDVTHEQLKLTIYNPSHMFGYKYQEHIKDCVDMLDLKEITLSDKSEINIKTNDAKLDLSSTIGHYVLAAFFRDIDVAKSMQSFYDTQPTISDREKQQWFNTLRWQLDSEHHGLYDDLRQHPNLYSLPYRKGQYSSEFKHDKRDIQWELVCLTGAECRDTRYSREIVERYVSKDHQKQIIERMSTIFKEDDNHEVNCFYQENKNDINEALKISGIADVVLDDRVYEVKFVNEISSEHLLQCAMYMIMLNKDVGRVWNIRDNKMIEIRIKDVQELLNRVVKCITKGRLAYWEM